jgi:hypothetical protein
VIRQKLALTSSHAPLQWTAEASDTWLMLDKASGPTPATLMLTVDPSDPALLAGVHRATLTISADNATGIHEATVAVTITIMPATLTVDHDSLLFTYSRASISPSQTVGFALNTGEQAHDWTVVSDPWLHLEPNSGTVSGTPASATIRVDVPPGQTGVLNGSITLSAEIGGEELDVAVVVTVTPDTHQLLVSDEGVALVSTPGLSKLSETVTVDDNFGLDTTWTATSDQSWLTVTSSGRSGAALTLTASPNSLATDKLYTAVVTLATADPAVDRADVIQVGFWVGAATPAARVDVSQRYSELVTDPIRPYAYVHSGGTALSIYHVYTGELVGTIDAVAPQLSYMAVSGDGAKLFVFDATNYRVVTVNLANRALSAPWSLSENSLATLAYGRSNGARLLYTGTGDILDITTGRALSGRIEKLYASTNLITASRSGTRACVSDTGLSPSTFACYTVAFHATPGHELSLKPSLPGSGGSNGQDVALSADGSRLYLASGAPYDFEVVDMTSQQRVQTLPGSTYPNNVEVTEDGAILAGASEAYGPTDVWVYQVDGFERGHFRFAGRAQELLAGQLKASGDGQRIVALTSDPLLTFVTKP